MQTVRCTSASFCSRRASAVGVLVWLVAFSCAAKKNSTHADDGEDENNKYELKWTVESASSPPVSLTASDGTGLALKTFNAKAVVQEPLAFTELHLAFENLENRVREGHFEITLPPGAAISRFAMKIGERWQEAEVVERQKARQTYEDFLHRRQDPALLEKKAGNQFRARVFPIEPNGVKEIIISYSQEVHRKPYTLYVAGLPMMDDFELEVSESISAGKVQKHRIHERNFIPKGNVAVLKDETLKRSTWTGLQHDDLRLIWVTPQFESSLQKIQSMTVLFDTSASRSIRFKDKVHRTKELIRALIQQNKEDFHLVFICFDQTVQRIYEGRASGFGDAEKKKLIERGALGASDLAKALSWVKENEKGSERLLIMSDGIVTAGQQAAGKLQRQIKALASLDVERADVWVDGGIRDEILLGRLVNAGLSRVGIVVDGEQAASTGALKLLKKTLAHVPVQVTHADWVWPNTIHGVQSGESYLVYAGAAPGTEVRIGLPGIVDTPQKISFEWVAKPLLERASAIAQIDMVSAALGDEDNVEKRSRLQKQLVELSVANRVLSDYTALLVLETEYDYQRYNIDRTALADILVVGKNGVERMTRDEASLRIGVSQKGALNEVGTVGAGNEPPNRSQTLQRKGDRAAAPMAASPEETRFSIRGPRDNPNPHMARQTVRDLAGTAAVGTTSDFGKAMDIPGVEPENALGALVGNQVGENFGYGGLGLSGSGRGGGGEGEGTIGLGNLNSIGHGGGGGSYAAYGRAAAGLGGRRGSAPRVRSGAAMVRGGISRDVIRRIVHRHINEVRFCYERELAREPELEGRVTLRFVISGSGAVQFAAVNQSTVNDSRVEQCMAQAVRRWVFPKTQDGGAVVVTYPFQLTAAQDSRTGADAQSDNVFEERAGGGSLNEDVEDGSLSDGELPPLFSAAGKKALEATLLEKATATSYEGRLEKVMSLLRNGELDYATREVVSWREAEPQNVLALVALGELFEVKNEKDNAARAYGSIIDFYPSRADMRRMAGERLERLGNTAKWLIVDTYKQAVKQRPDHPASHRLYAWALFRVGKIEEALSAMNKGLIQQYPDGRFLGVVDGMKNEMRMMAAAWKAMDVENPKMMEKLKSHHLQDVQASVSTRFVLHWESDANDVDLHVFDHRGRHAFYQQKQLSSGGELAADVTTGYGPEFFTIRGKVSGAPYTLQAHYYSRGPMGYGMGTLQIIEDDGKGNLTWQFRPFVVMQDGAFVGLGQFKK